jgi:CubicO group peptidase (beta-lactamase class C family)
MTDSFAVNRLDEADARVPKGHIFIFGRPIAISNPAFFLGGAGGVVSSAADMAKWLQFQQFGTVTGTSQPLLLPASIDAMHRASAPGVPYGLGWFVESATHPPQVSHEGLTPTFTAYASVSLDDGFDFAVLSNGARTFLRGSRASYVEFAVREVAQGREPISYGVSTRDLDIALLVLSMLICAAALLSTRPNRAHRSRVRKWLVIVIWLGMLMATFAIPKLFFEFIGGRAQAWTIGFESSAWGWLFYVSPMGALLCAVIAISAVIALVAAAYRLPH